MIPTNERAANIRFVAGDVLLTRCDAIAHGVNSSGVMGAGIAKIIAEALPDMYRSYREHCELRMLRVGAVEVWRKSTPMIVNMCTQRSTQGADIHYVHDAFAELHTMIHYGVLRIGSLAMPKIASGLGGLDWDQVLPIIVRELSDLPIHIYIYTEFLPGVRGVEEDA